MDDLSLRAIGTRAFVSARLSEMESALDGFPVAILLDDCLSVDELGGAVDRSAHGLVEHVLIQWTSMIERDLEQFPPATIDVLKAIRQRMVDVRHALLRVRALLRGLSDLTPPNAEPNERSSAPQADQIARKSLLEVRTGAGTPGGASCDTLRHIERDVVLQGNSRRAALPAHWPTIAASMTPSRQTESARR